MNYCKIRTDGQAYPMPDPYRMTIANPTDEQKALIAQLDNWLEMVQTEPPEYDPETQYVTSYWVEDDGKAVQVWEIHELPTPEPSIEDRLDSLEQNVSDIIGGATE